MVICLERGADLHTAQLMPLPHTVSCFSKIQIGLPFWYRLTRVVPDNGPLNGCVCPVEAEGHGLDVHGSPGSGSGSDSWSKSGSRLRSRWEFVFGQGPVQAEGLDPDISRSRSESGSEFEVGIQVRIQFWLVRWKHRLGPGLRSRPRL